MADTTLHDRILRSFQAQGLMTTLGATLVHVGDGEVRIALPFSPAITQQQGFGHAGAITSIVDSACGYAALTKAPPGFEVVTAEFKTKYLQPLGFEAVGDTPEQFAAFLKGDRELGAQKVKVSGAKLD